MTEKEEINSRDFFLLHSLIDSLHEHLKRVHFDFILLVLVNDLFIVLYFILC